MTLHHYALEMITKMYKAQYSTLVCDIWPKEKTLATQCPNLGCNPLSKFWLQSMVSLLVASTLWDYVDNVVRKHGKKLTISTQKAYCTCCLGTHCCINYFHFDGRKVTDKLEFSKRLVYLFPLVELV